VPGPTLGAGDEAVRKTDKADKTPYPHGGCPIAQGELQKVCIS